MPFAAALSQHPLATHAVGEVVGQVLERLGDAPDAAVVFVTAPFAGATEDITAAVRAMLQPAALVACTASGVLAGAQEVEAGAAISLFAVNLPDGAPPATAGAIAATRVGEDWRFDTGLDLTVSGATLVLLADPFSFPIDAYVDHLATDHRGLQVIGGLASAATGPGGNVLVADGEVRSHGAVALVLPPGWAVHPLVSQGCRPIGDPLVVTRAQGTMIEEIAGVAALDRLMATAEAASPDDRRRLARNLHLGVAVREGRGELDRSDFVTRGVLGADRVHRAVAIDAEVEVGTTVCFQGRDAETADEDLRLLLADAPGDAALVFTCTGRGTQLFGEPHHDAEVLADHVEGSAVAGMFCSAAIAPVGARHYVHAMSTGVLLFEDQRNG